MKRSGKGKMNISLFCMKVGLWPLKGILLSAMMGCFNCFIVIRVKKGQYEYGGGVNWPIHVYITVPGNRRYQERVCRENQFLPGSNKPLSGAVSCAPELTSEFRNEDGKVF